MSRRAFAVIAATAVAACIVVWPPAREATADARPLPPDLALVPTDAVGFAHVRATELWAHPDLKPWRAVFEQAGPRTIGLLDQHFAPKPSTTDRVTFVLMPTPPKGSRGRNPFDPLNPVLILHFSAPFDKEQVKQAHAEKSKAKTVAGREVVLAERTDVALAFIDDRTLVLGEEVGVTAVLSAGGKAGPLSPALRMAGEGKPIVAAVNLKALPDRDQLVNEIPDEYKAAADADVASAVIDLGKEPTLDVRLTFPNPESAKAGEKALRKLGGVARIFLNARRSELTAELAAHLKGKKGAVRPQRPLGDFPEAALMVAGVGGLNFLDDLLAHPPMDLNGADLVSKVPLPAWSSQFLAGGALAAGVFTPAVQKVRESAENMRANNNLKQIGLALHNYHDTIGTFPPAATLNKKGKKLLSWRVAILPYIEQNALYNQFKQDEAWDSEHNKKFSDTNVLVYADPRLELKPAHTVYKAPVGNGAVFDWFKGHKLTSITDGTSNTAMVLAGGDPVPWASPQDFEHDPKVEFPADYAKAFDDRLTVLYADASVRSINLATLKNRAQTMRWLIERADGNVLNIDD